MANTYLTGNSVPSTALKDLSDNASNFDEAMNLLGPAFVDRTGRRRETWYGMQQSFQNFLLASGYEPAHLQYVDGQNLTVLRVTQLIDRAGSTYRIKLPANFPVSLTGNWAADSGQLVEVEDPTLRQNLASADPLFGAALVFGTSRVVDSIADLIKLPATGSKHVFVLGYYGKGTRGGGQFTQIDNIQGAKPNGGTLIAGSSGVFWGRVAQGKTYTTDFGAKADGTGDDSDAVAAWFAYGLSAHVDMIVAKGVHRMMKPAVWDFTSVASVGAQIKGEGSWIDNRLDFSSCPANLGRPFQAYGGENVALFYIYCLDFSITTAYPSGPGVTFGRDDLSDAFNEGGLRLWVNNTSLSDSMVTMRLNHMLHNEFRLVCNGGGSGRPDQQYYPGHGTALEMRQCIMNNCMVAVGNANKGLYLTGGYTYGNFFNAIDIEEVNYGLLIDSPNVVNNTWVAGQWYAYNLLNATAGRSNRIVNPNIALYSGGRQNVSTVGLEVELSPSIPVGTPPMVSSGTYAANDTGRKIAISIKSGTVSAINVLQANGATIGYPIGTWYGYDLILLPGESISITHSSAPAWLWRPA